MERRLILAITLSLLALLIWSGLVSKLYHIENKEVTIKKVYLPEPIQQPLPSLLNFSQEKFEVVFNEQEAAITRVIFKSYQDYNFNLKYGLLLGDQNLNFKKESITSKSIIFVYQDENKRIIKRFIFPNSNYNIGLEIEIQNLSNLPLNINLPLILGVLNFNQDPHQARFKDAIFVTKEKTLHLNCRKNITLSDIKFLGLRERYFCAIIEPEENNFTGFIKKINSQESELGLIPKEFKLLAGQQIKQKFHIYLGPQDLKEINRIKPDWTVVIYYGAFNFISHLLLQLLNLLYRLVHNWGWSIVILSILIYILLYPLVLKQMRSMKQMQTLQPAIEELRKAYKDNPQKLNKEIMELYRKRKINPFSGCLPLILQIPIFIALYQVLIRSVSLKGAKFLWIKDLSEADRLFILPVSLPIIGNEINILPILMTLGMFIQQKISPTSTTSSGQQRLMMIIFPLLFGFIFYHMPSGLVLYWFTNGLLMLICQLRISKIK